MSEDKRPPQLSLSDVRSGVGQVERVGRPSLRDQLEAVKEEHRTAVLKNEKLEAQILSIQVTIKLRIVYSILVFSYLVGYSGVVYYLIWRAGIGGIKVPSEVLVTAAGATAIAAIGLVSQIGKGLFPSK